MANLQPPTPMDRPDGGTSEAFGILVAMAVGIILAVMAGVLVLAAMQEWGARR